MADNIWFNRLRLTALNLACERGGRRVFDNINFTLSEGALLELRGANGAGKSSLLRLIAGLVEPSQGQINCQPEDCHYVGHADTHKPTLTVVENLNFWAEFFGETFDLSALEHFNLQKLGADQTYLLSAGQKRRLSLTRLMLTKRKIWLLDEPMVGLDAASQNQLLSLMKKHIADAGIIISATHTDLGLKATQVLHLGVA